LPLETFAVETRLFDALPLDAFPVDAWRVPRLPAKAEFATPIPRIPIVAKNNVNDFTVFMIPTLFQTNCVLNAGSAKPFGSPAHFHIRQRNASVTTTMNFLEI
jgi:hypothetical protein